MFLAHAQRYGNKVLYRYAERGRWQSLTWAESLARVREIALGLASVGVRPGDRVAILSNNRVEWYLADWAAICIGALTVPIYASSTLSQALHILGHCEPVLLFVDSWKRLEQLNAPHSSLNLLKTLVVFEPDMEIGHSDWGGKIRRLDSLREMGRSYDFANAGAFERVVASLRSDDDLTIIYTSGTTGTPKGVLTTHGHYLFMIRAIDRAISSTDRDVTLHFLPPAHSLGRLEHFMAVAKGWTFGIGRSIETIPSDLRAIRPTIIFSVPRIYQNAYNRIRLRLGRAGAWRRNIFNWGLRLGMQRIHNQKEAANWRAALVFACIDRLIFARVRAAFGGRLRLAISGGATLGPDIAEFFHVLGLLILEGYGLTETSTVSHVNRLQNYKFGTVGLPLEGTSCRIGSDGEILLQGPHIFKCYYRDVMATEEAIDADGWFHTGDIGTIDGDGFLRIVDRKKDLIVTSGGKKIAPQKLENLLQMDPLIHQALIFGGGQRHLLALITLDRNHVAELARKEGIVIEGADEMAAHPWVRARVRDIIRRTNNELAPFEAIRNFCILSRDFTVEAEELTPTLKPRRQVIAERYRDLIEEMYRKAS
jgi:long-chain acyl-CoA synthetase